MQFSQMLRPGAKAHALDASMDQNVGSSVLGHRTLPVCMAGIGVTPGVILIERLDNALSLLRVRLTRKSD